MSQALPTAPSVIDLSSIDVTGFFATDNNLTAITVGTQSTTSVSGGGFGALSNLATAPTPAWSSLFQPTGDNTLSFVVNNAGSPTGLYANVSISATCVAPVTITTSSSPASPAKAAPGSTVSQTITLENTGSAASASVALSNALTGVVASSQQWSCSDGTSGTGALSSQTVSVAPGATVSCTVSGTAAADTATVTSSPSVDNTGGSAGLLCGTTTTAAASCPVTALDTPMTQAHMTVTQTQSPKPARVGKPATITTTCTNQGPDAAVNATCAVSGAPAGAVTTCTPSVPDASLASGASIVCTTKFTPASTNPVTLTVDTGSDTTDPNPLAPASLDFTLAIGEAAGIPALGGVALLLLALLLGVSAVAVKRRGR